MKKQLKNRFVTCKEEEAQHVYDLLLLLGCRPTGLALMGHWDETYKGVMIYNNFVYHPQPAPSFESLNPITILELERIEKGVLNVNPKNYYPNTDYIGYIRDGEHEFLVGDVVIDPEGELGIVLGCIDAYDGTMRVDSNGIVSMDGCRHATIEDVMQWHVGYRGDTLRNLIVECVKQAI
jgi:hypothetical protein